jgi:hypothetical protein
MQPSSLLPSPSLPSRPGWLTGVLAKDCVAHELEEAFSIEAGAVDRDCVLEEKGWARRGH